MTWRFYFFFFSSRRRHTRYWRDWSSDVCSSDLNIEENYSKGSDLTGLDTGFKDLNDKLGGFHKSDLILIAARPGMGKTAFALNLVANAALRSKAKVAVFSLEMSDRKSVV